MPRSSLLRVLQAKGMTDLGVDLTTGERRFRVPLPADVDKAFDSLQIMVRGKSGFRPCNCVGLRYTHYHPDPTILEVVEHAEIPLDELIPGPDILVDRGLVSVFSDLGMHRDDQRTASYPTSNSRLQVRLRSRIHPSASPLRIF